MTLAQNLPRLSSGSNILLLLVLFVALSGCSSEKKASKAKTQDRDERISLQDSITRAQLDSILAIASDTLADTIIDYRKDTYNIALILPFYLDSLNADTTVKKGEFVYSPSTMALDYYQGTLFALDSLKQLGLSAKVHVFDSENNTRTVKKLIKKPVMKNMDLIIGPIYNDNLRLMADFAKEDSIYMVSPLSPAENITKANPFYIMANPSIEVHCRKIFQYVVDQYYYENILILAQPTSVEWRYAKLFEQFLDEYQQNTNDYSLFFTEVIYDPEEENKYYKNDEEDDDGMDFSIYMDMFQQNIVVVPSVDRAYIHNVSRKLNSLVEDFDIKVVGLPVWGDYNSLRLDYIEKLGVHYTSSYWVDQEFYTDKKGLYQTYLDSFKTEPSEVFIKGYDLMFYFGKELIKHGTNLKAGFEEDEMKAIHTTFNFAPSYLKLPDLVATTDTTVAADSLKQQKINFIENKYVNLLKYDRYDIKKVN